MTKCFEISKYTVRIIVCHVKDLIEFLGKPDRIIFDKEINLIDDCLNSDENIKSFLKTLYGYFLEIEYFLQNGGLGNEVNQ